MKIGMHNGLKLAIALFAVIAIGVVGCGGGGGSSAGGSSGGGTSTNLKGALYSTVNTAPAVSLVSSTLQRQATATPIQNANVTYVSDQTGIAGFNTAKIRVASATTDVNGVASFAVPNGSYTAQLSGTTNDQVVGENAAYFSTETVSSSGSKIYQADKYSWVITSTVALKGVRVLVYQTDSAGTLDWGNYNYAADPMSLSVARAQRNPAVFDKSSTFASSTTVTENVELFKGYYRVVLAGTPNLASEVVATYISPVFTVAGGGNVVPNSVSVGTPIKAPTLTLKGTNGALITTAYRVDFYENTNKIFIGSAANSTGVVSIGAPSGVTSVVAKIYDAANAYKGVYVFSDLNNTFAATLQQFTIAGQIKPSSGTLDATSVPVVYVRTDSGLGRWADSTDVATVNAAAGTGAYNTLTLFGSTPALNYKIAARNVKGFPDVTKLGAAVSATMTSQDITVAPGGILLGKIQTEAKVDMPNVPVYIFGTAADGVIELVTQGVTTNIVGTTVGDYSIEVPYGTYFMLVNGAVTDSITISAGAPTYTKSLTEYTMTGQVSKNLGSTTTGANGASVLGGFQTATTNNLGAYSIKLMEGKNWLCAAPSLANDPTYGYTCTLNVLVDKDTVAAARM